MNSLYSLIKLIIMNKYSFFLFFSLTILSSCSTEETTVYYLIRHAEKDRTDNTNINPNLNKIGQDRAIKWASYFKNVHLDAIYSTTYNRTLQTAAPTARVKKLQILNYNPTNMFNKDFKEKTKGKVTLIVGHSNTTPVFVNKILGDEKYQNMDDNDNSSLYVVKINKHEKNSLIKKIN